MKKSIPVLLCALLVFSVAAGDDSGAPAEGRSFGDVDHWVKIFDSESRGEWQKPLRVLEALGITNGDRVADLGAGTGYFTGLLTTQVGNEGKVYAVDIEQALLDHILTRFDVVPERLELIRADPDDPRLPAGEIDLVLIVNTWHHLGKRSKYIRKLAASLTPEGRVVVIDYREGELPVGPPPDQKVGRAAVIAEFEKAKWSLVSENVTLPYQYFLTFYPPAKR
jgi:ubiquinone/menaquinone biosynthesis C-methylase UbiE